MYKTVLDPSPLQSGPQSMSSCQQAEGVGVGQLCSKLHIQAPTHTRGWFPASFFAKASSTSDAKLSKLFILAEVLNCFFNQGVML